MPVLLRVCVAALFAAASLAGTSAQTVGANVIIVTIDGLRWQEFFGGAHREYFKRDKQRMRRPGRNSGSGATTPGNAARRSCRSSGRWWPSNGQIFGDRQRRQPTRRHERIVVLVSRLQRDVRRCRRRAHRQQQQDPESQRDRARMAEQAGRAFAAASRPSDRGTCCRRFSTWSAAPFLVGTGWQPGAAPATDRDRAVNQLAARPAALLGVQVRSTPPSCMPRWRALRTQQPRVLYLMLGEGDEWAHEGKYDLYLDATRRAERSSSGSGTPRSRWTPMPAAPRSS